MGGPQIGILSVTLLSVKKLKAIGSVQNVMLIVRYMSMITRFARDRPT